MNTENNELANIDAITMSDHCDPTFVKRDTASELPHKDSKSTSPAVKEHRFRRPMFVISGAALCMALSSCILPYDNYGGPTTTTTYRQGYRVNSLPSGYQREYISGREYYYHNGNYYQPQSGAYVIVNAPRTSRYYDDYSRRQQSVRVESRVDQRSYDRRERRYEREEFITRLPRNHRVVNHRGMTYYRVGDQYYTRQNDVYVVVRSPY